jgi:hypothetical protein
MTRSLEHKMTIMQYGNVLQCALISVGTAVSAFVFKRPEGHASHIMGPVARSIPFSSTEWRFVGSCKRYDTRRNEIIMACRQSWNIP